MRQAWMSGCGLAIVGLMMSLCLGGDAAPAANPGGGETAGAARALMHLSTDKPIYRVGERVYVRGVMLGAIDHSPYKAASWAMVEIRGPKGDIVASGQSQMPDAILSFAWDVPAEQAGGEYTCKASFPMTGDAPAERKFDIRAYRAPRLKTQIVFLRDGYGPGDVVRATLHAERAEGGTPAGAGVTVLARVDGAEVHRGPAVIDAHGNCAVSFPLPNDIARGEGTLALVITDGGVVETASKSIPILLQTVDLKIFPEGGDLVAGLENRVYFQARTPADKPADLKGELIDDTGAVVTRFASEHEGRGRFGFTPAAGRVYSMKITEPAGIKTAYPLPAALAKGAVIRSADDVTAASMPVRVKIASTSAGKIRLTLGKRGETIAEQSITFKDPVPAGANFSPVNTFAPVQFDAPAELDGVLTVTAWDESGKPLTERLVFRAPARKVNVRISADSPGRGDYVPGDRVTLKVRTTDEAGKPLAATVGIAVSDDAVLEMIEKREQAPRLPAMALLENDVVELRDAGIYLDSDNPIAPLATDLLLGTQGWRRFAAVDVKKFVAEHGDAARRALAVRQPPRQLGFARGGGVAVAFAAAAMPENMPDEAAAVANDKVLPPNPRGPVDEKKEELKGDLRRQLAEDQKRKALEKPVVMGKLRMADKPMPLRDDFVIIREYAHAVRKDRSANDRIDFADTLYFNPAVRTDAVHGEATVSFDLSDSVTTFRALADGFDDRGALGQGGCAVQSIRPFYVEPKLPLEVTVGDEVLLPVTVVNAGAAAQPDVRTSVVAPGVVIKGVQGAALSLDPRQSARLLVRMEIGAGAVNRKVRLEATAGEFSDNVTRELRVVPRGFPIEWSRGGLLEPGVKVTHKLTIPKNAVPGGFSSAVVVYPTPLASMTGALERLIQEPNGCFEQTSSTSYPLVMAQQYFLTHQGVEPALIQRSRDNLDSAYKRLTGFECPKKGYEWFGGDPGHEALTAYGLMQFVDMSQVRSVDPAMLERTRQWLLDRRDGKGSFQRNQRALDSFGGAPQETTDAYITWALLESGQRGLEKEVAHVNRLAADSRDSYVIALGANVAFLSGDADTGRALLSRLDVRQAKSGAIEGGESSITRSGGDALAIETTALGVLAWMRDPASAAQVENGLKFLAESCKAGRFGSTQSTILALRAIVQYDKARARPRAAGSLMLWIDEKPAGEPLAFDADTRGALSLPDITARFSEPGEHTVTLAMDAGSPMPFSITVNYHALQPDSSEKCVLDLAVKMPEADLREGEITEMTVTVRNRSETIAPNPVAIIGLSGGTEPRHDQLKELVKRGSIDAYEVRGREVILYWRALKPQQRIELPITLIAAIPGDYTAPASRAYLYYTDEFKHWFPGTHVTIRPKAMR